MVYHFVSPALICAYPVILIAGSTEAKEKGAEAPPKRGPDSSAGRVPRIARLMALAIKFQDMIDRGEIRDYAELACLGYVKDRHKMERRLGRIQARHPQVSDLYEVALREGPEGVRLHWAIREDRKVWRGLREGAYMLRTHCCPN